MEPSNLLEWIADTPFTVAFFIIALPSMVLSIIGIMAIRIIYPDEERIGSQVVGAKINYMAEAYSLVLGLFLVSAYDGYQGMQSVLKTEAFALGALHQIVQQLPPERADPIREEIRLYTREVIAEEWPLMKFGEESPATRQDLGRIFAMISEAGKDSDSGRGIAVQATQLAREIMVQRAQRLTSGPGEGDTLSSAFSNFLVILTLIAIAMPWFVYTPSPFIHLLMGGALLVVFISIIILAVKMLYPFAGELAIQPTDFQVVLMDMLEQAANDAANTNGAAP